MRDFKYKVLRRIGTISDDGKVSKQVNLISYNDRMPVIDIRRWKDGEMQKGITLTEEEAWQLVKVIQDNL